MALSLVTLDSMFIYTILFTLIITFGAIFIIQVVDTIIHYSPAQRREREEQANAAILQAATRRRLSARRPVSPYRYRQCKPTKSAARKGVRNYNSD